MKKCIYLIMVSKSILYKNLHMNKKKHLSGTYLARWTLPRLQRAFHLKTRNDTPEVPLDVIHHQNLTSSETPEEPASEDVMFLMK